MLASARPSLVGYLLTHAFKDAYLVVVVVHCAEFMLLEIFGVVFEGFVMFGLNYFTLV